jgi:hypothetical protein
MSSRPRGVVALALILLFFGVLGIVLGTIFGSLSIFSVSQLLGVWPTSFSVAMFFVYSGFPIDAAFLYAFVISYYVVESNAVINQTWYIGIDILSIVFAITGIGLFRMKRWGRYLALALGIIMIIGGIISLLGIVGIIPLVIGIVIVVYLTRDVKYEFE